VRDIGARRIQPIDAIRAGLPVAALRSASAYFDLPQQHINAIARVPNTTAHTWARQNATMDSAVSERVWRMADVAAMAQEVFGSAEAAKAWLRMPNRAFRDDSPLEFLDTEPGAAAVRQVLNAIATGGVA
jgi:putative toxin-antitoxin system antitoxin component (TIGR02293 family)